MRTKPALRIHHFVVDARQRPIVRQQTRETIPGVRFGSVGVGAVSAFLFGNVIGRFSDVPSAIVMQFIGSFAVASCSRTLATRSTIRLRSCEAACC